MRSPVPILCVLALAGCGATTTTPPAGPGATTTPRRLAALVARSRPIGATTRFRPALRERPVAACRPGLGPRVAAHLELFAADRVVLIPAGIGSRAPRSVRDGRVVSARCFGPLVTLDPTGVVLMRPGPAPTLGALFAGWGAPLSPRRLLSFHGPVSVFVNGRRMHGDPRALPLTRHAEIVLEVGPLVAPHRSYTFAPGS